MRFLDFFRTQQAEPTARLAKERLKIIVAHERNQKDEPDYLPRLRQELIDVISKYVSFDKESINVQLERDGDCSILELNITLPDKAA